MVRHLISQSWSRPAKFLSVALLSARLAYAQGGHPQPPPPPPGAKSSKCSARPIPQLEDITSKTGITFKHTSDPAKKYIVESMSGGVILFDYDRDGWLDIYFTNAPSVEMAIKGQKARGALYRNNHDGTFTDATGKSGLDSPCFAMGGAVGDYDNDGWPDLLVTCFGGVVLYRNNGDGTFTDVTRQAGLSNDSGWATGAVFGDYDGDGWPDLFVSHYVNLNLNDLPAFGSSPTCKFRGIAVQCGPRGLKGFLSNLYHNNGDGTFSDVSKKTGIADSPNSFGLTAVWSDFDSDGHLDLFLANDAGRNYLYKNDGSGHFTDIGFSAGVAVNQDGNEQANMGVALGDYKHTGRPSIVISHFSDEYAALFQNLGEMNFSDVSYASGIAPSTTHYAGWGDAFFDFDNDGWVDLFMVNGHVYPQVDTGEAGARYQEPGLLFLNQRNGKFKDISKLVGPAPQLPRVSRGVATGDLFNDGRIDIVIEKLQGGPTILRPQGGPSNHWISFELVGTKSNRLALNARVRVTAGDLVQPSEVLSGGSYPSQNDLRIHFGLGGRERVDKLEIFWPTGKIETLTNLAADHFYDVKEGEGLVSADTIRPARPKN